MLTKPEFKFSTLVIGGIVNAVVISMLESYDNRLAMIYTVLLFIIVMVAYKDEIFPAINAIFATIERGTN